MNYRVAVLAATVLGPAIFLLTGQETAAPAVFTAAQAEAGRVAYENGCGKCHTPSLLGRTGQLGELPALNTIPEKYQAFIGPRGFVPPLAGKTFMSRWGTNTAAQLISRFQETVDFFQLEDDKETTVNITAYVLQVNGAKAGAQPLTRSTTAVVSAAAR